MICEVKGFDSTCIVMPTLKPRDRAYEKAKQVLDYTGADAVMIGRAAQGRPWIFRETAHYLKTGEFLPEPEIAEVESILMEHLVNDFLDYA